MLPMRKTIQGFSLVEITLVLGIMGLVLSAIWVIAPWGNETAKQKQLSSEIYETVRNVRAFYAGRFGIGGATTTLVPQLYTQNALMDEAAARTIGGCSNSIVVGGVTYDYCLDNPWGYTATTAAAGSFGICAWTPGTSTSCTPPPAGVVSSSQFFAVEIISLSTASCISAVTNNVGTSSQPGLIDVLINGVSIESSLGATTAAAATQCAATPVPAGSLARIDFVYRLLPPQS